MANSNTLIKKLRFYKVAFLIILGVLASIIYASFYSTGFLPSKNVGQKIDSLNGIYVYHNGGVDNIEGRNLTGDGYNLGLKYQCVEFVKRYYFRHLDHKMPNSYGHAKDFYNSSLKDGEFNSDRGLIQFDNPSSIKPQVNDLLIFSPTIFNEFGHVAIISAVKEDEIEIIQQNAGAFSSPRETFLMSSRDEKWQIEDSNILGWLRKE